ncbi:MAG: hypothetical protein V4515_08220 [Chloroflexota bacterium]
MDEDLHPQPHEQSVLKTSAAMGGRFLPDEVKKIAPQDLARARISLMANSLIISRMNTIDLVGECGYVDQDYPDLFLPDRLWLATPLPGADVSMRWLSYLLSSTPVRRAMSAAATGTSGSMKNISKPSLLAIEVVRPPLHEQERIATALSHLDDAAITREALISKKKDLREAVRQALMQGAIRLSGYSTPWDEVTLGQAGTFVRGVSYDPERDLTRDDDPGTVRLLRANNIQSGVLNATDIQHVRERRVSAAQVLRPRDIVVCAANGSRQLVGKAAGFHLNDGHTYTFGAFMVCYRSDPLVVDPRFAVQLLQTRRYREQVDVALAGSSINNLGPAALAPMSFLVPSLLEEQRAVAAVLEDLDHEVAVNSALLAKLHDLKTALAQELLSGRTRLA